jgi:endonuclease/exonuclease/phosphatase family metal-dependent hydrolase
VVPSEWSNVISPDDLNKQFARTPYAVSFKAGSSTFILTTLHINYGDVAEDRIPELTGIAIWMADWAKRINEWEHNLFTLGDFNIDRKDSPLWQAFTSTGLTVPTELEKAKRTLFSNPTNPSLDKYYDQVAWFESGGAALTGLTYKKGGSFDFLPYVYNNQGLTKNDISFRISDHYPLWVEFGI